MKASKVSPRKAMAMGLKKATGPKSKVPVAKKVAKKVVKKAAKKTVKVAKKAVKKASR